MYDIKWFRITIKILLDNIKDLEEWSVYNQDRQLNKIIDLKKQIEDLKAEVEFEEYDMKQILVDKYSGLAQEMRPQDEYK